PATVERYGRSLLLDVQHLQGMVESYLRLATPLAQEDTSHHVPVHVHDVLLAAAHRCRFVASTREVTIAPELGTTADGAPVEGRGDAGLLAAVLEALGRNAVLSARRGSSGDLRVGLIGKEVRVAVVHRGPPLDAAETECAFG